MNPRRRRCPVEILFISDSSSTEILIFSLERVEKLDQNLKKKTNMIAFTRERERTCNVSICIKNKVMPWELPTEPAGLQNATRSVKS